MLIISTGFLQNNESMGFKKQKRAIFVTTQLRTLSVKSAGDRPRRPEKGGKMRKNGRSARILAAALLTAVMGVGTVSAAAAAIKGPGSLLPWKKTGQGSGNAAEKLIVVCGVCNAAYQRKDGVYVVPITMLKQ